MPLTTINTATAILASNLFKQGRIVLFSPIVDFGTLVKTAFADLGYFPTDATIAPSNTVNRTDVTAANREGGADVVLASNVTSLTIGYDIPVLTPDAIVRKLYNGATPRVLATTLAAVEGYVVDPSAKLTGRMIVVRKRPPAADGTRTHQVVFHPRVDLSPNGTGNSNGQDTLIFRADVRAFDWTPSALLGAATYGSYGAQFEVPDTKLQALLDELSTAAAPA